MNISIDLSQIIIGIVNFLILYVVLDIVLFKPFMKNMEQRKDMQAKTIKENEDKKQLLDSLREEYSQAIKNQELTKQEIIINTKNSAANEYKKIIEQAKLKSKEIEEQAKFKAEAERLTALENAKKDIAGISLMIASKLTEENMNTVKNKELASKYMSEVEVK